MASVEAVLAEYKESDYTVKLARTLFGAVPLAPEFVLYPDLAGAVGRLTGGAGDPALVERVRALAAEEAVGQALWVSDALDKADAGLAVMSGVKNLFSLFSGGGSSKRTFESDPQQAADAALKLVGLAYMANKVLPGATMAEKASHLTTLPAGREALVYSAVVEIGLPFLDNLVEGGTGAISKLLSGRGSAAASRLGSFAGAGAAADATSFLNAMAPALADILGQVRGHLGGLGSKMGGLMPGALGAADSVTGAVASGLDALPVWRFLGARLAAEGCVLRASSL